MSSYVTRRTARENATESVFTFHGTGGDENQFHGFAEQLYPDATVISPRGNVDEHGMARFFRRTGEGVYDMDDLSIRVSAMARFLADERVPGGRSIGLGYSNGANIMAAVAFRAPEAFDQMILMHPLIPWTPDPQPGLVGKRILITAGRRDPICPALMTQTLADYYRAQGADVSLVWHDGGHEIAQTEVAAIRDFAAS